MTVKEITKQYLINNGFGGLYTTDCGCDLNDLMPCAGLYSDPTICEPGMKKDCAKCEDNQQGECEYDDPCVGPREEPHEAATLIAELDREIARKA